MENGETWQRSRFDRSLLAENVNSHVHELVGTCKEDRPGQ